MFTPPPKALLPLARVSTLLPPNASGPAPPTTPNSVRGALTPIVAPATSVTGPARADGGLQHVLSAPASVSPLPSRMTASLPTLIPVRTNEAPRRPGPASSTCVPFAAVPSATPKAVTWSTTSSPSLRVVGPAYELAPLRVSDEGPFVDQRAGAINRTGHEQPKQQVEGQRAAVQMNRAGNLRRAVSRRPGLVGCQRDRHGERRGATDRQAAWPEKDGIPCRRIEGRASPRSGPGS